MKLCFLLTGNWRSVWKEPVSHQIHVSVLCVKSIFLRFIFQGIFPLFLLAVHPGVVSLIFLSDLIKMEVLCQKLCF